MLDDNRRFVLAIAHALETHKTITGEDIDAIFRGTAGPTLDGGCTTRRLPALVRGVPPRAPSRPTKPQAKPSRELPVIASRRGWAPTPLGAAAGRPCRGARTHPGDAVTEPVSPATGWGVLHLFCQPRPQVDGEAVPR